MVMCVSMCVRIIWCCLAENRIQIVEEEVVDDQRATLHVDDNKSPQIEVTAAEDSVGDPTGETSQPYVSGEVEHADDASRDSDHSGRAEVPVMDNNGDTAGQRTGTPQTHHRGSPVGANEGEAATSPDGGGQVERDRSGTSKSDDGGRAVEVQFDDDQMLLERDGKFRIVNTDDVMADDEVRSQSSSSSSDAALRVSSMSVKTSSGGARGRVSGQRTATQPPVPRSKSAVTAPGSRRRSADYNTTHRLTEEQKRQLERQQACKAERARQEEQRRKENEEKKRQECDDAFQAWLRRKRVDAAQRRRERIQEMREEKEKNNKNKVITYRLFTAHLLSVTTYIRIY